MCWLYVEEILIKKKREEEKVPNEYITVHPTREPCDAMMISPLRNIARSHGIATCTRTCVSACTPGLYTCLVDLLTDPKNTGFPYEPLRFVWISSLILSASESKLTDFSFRTDYWHRSQYVGIPAILISNRMSNRYFPMIEKKSIEKSDSIVIMDLQLTLKWHLRREINGLHHLSVDIMR